jgi:hypothetical protein
VSPNDEQFGRKKTRILIEELAAWLLRKATLERRKERKGVSLGVQVATGSKTMGKNSDTVGGKRLQSLQSKSPI